MVLRRFIVFTVILLLLVAAPVWANTAAIAYLPRIKDAVTIDGSLDTLTAIDRTYFMKIGDAWTP